MFIRVDENTWIPESNIELIERDDDSNGEIGYRIYFKEPIDGVVECIHTRGFDSNEEAISFMGLR